MRPEGWVRLGHVLARPDSAGEVAALGLASARPPHGARALRLAPLHRTFLVPGAAGAERILKVHLGRPIFDLLRDLPTGRALLPPARIECENLLELRERGFSVPEPIAWGREGPESFALLRPVPGIPLDEWLRRSRDREARRRVLVDLARLIARFHDEGRYHRDLYACHVLVSAHGGLSLIDLARARRGRFVRRRWFVKDLAALSYSLPSAAASGADRVRFLRAYLGARRR
ncbi:MAG TPA: lipopolysaccharide kinase InaA family protein, partial [Planctomycetota bacterium]|nr:lipopolysaccharide kinase InaA family protein [Planctomycetota bacterium]